MRALIVVAGIAAAVVLFFVIEREGETSFEPAGPRTQQAEPVETAATTPEAVAPRRVGLNATIEIRDGELEGGIRRLVVQRGGFVVLVVRSDADDELHVHGYDLTLRLRPRVVRRLAFRATVVGRFEIELEERGVLIAELEVRP